MPSIHLARAIVASTLLGLAAATAAAAQTAPTLDLGKRTARSKYAFAWLVAVHELPDGRVVASDSKEAAFRLLDLAKGTDALIGKQGDDDDAYRSAGGLFAGRDDTLLLYDARGRKFLELAPNGTISGMVPFATPSTRVHHVGIPAATDSSGAIYSSCIDIDTTVKPMAHMSQSLCRVTSAAADQNLLSLDSRHADQPPVKGLQIFPFRDAWAVRRDGTVALVMADSYDVVWSRDGHEIGRTGPLAYQPIPLTPDEQKAATDSVRDMLKAFRSSVAMAPPAQGNIGSGATTMVGGNGITMTRIGGGGDAVGFATDGAAPPSGRAGAPAPGNVTMMNPADIPIAPFPPAKPPIPSTGTVAIFDANGLLWVARERAHGDNIPKYDVIAEGKGVVAHVTLPANTRLIGFGPHAVYLAHLDGDEEWLERYNLPPNT